MTLMTLVKCLIRNSKILNKAQSEKLKNLEILTKKTTNNLNSFKSIRQFSTTASNRSGIIPPLLWLIAKPLTKLSALIAGR